MSRYVARTTTVAARKIGGEMVILSAEDSSVFVLNDVGTAIWEALDGSTPLDAIAEAVALEYDVDAATARADIHEFVAALAAAGVLATSDEAVS
jgi:Coenzyme PQQ synthesis protein D (PqqD)